MTRKKGYLKILYRNYYQFQKAGFLGIVTLFIEPLFFLSAFGLGLGNFVNNIEGLSYIDFFFPGLLCATAAVVPLFETSRHQFQKPSRKVLYALWLTTPISRRDIITGEILWATVKGVLSAVAVVLVAMPMGLVQSWLILPAFIILSIISFLFASLGAVTVTAREFLFSFLTSPSNFVLPMVLISGVFYSVDLMILPLKILTYFLPLVHGTEIVRDLLRGTVSWSFLFHTLYLLGASVLFFRLALSRLEKKLTL